MASNAQNPSRPNPSSTSTPGFPTPIPMPSTPGDQFNQSPLQTPNTGVDQGHIQFATYKEDGYMYQSIPTPSNTDRGKTWVPVPLRPYVWIPLIAVLFGAAIALEVLLFVSNKNDGWASGSTEREQQALHYAYTVPPVVVASIIVACWVWTDGEIKKMQPYVDLAHGDAPPQRSLLLDYSKDSNLVALKHAFSNQHYIVALATLMVFLTISFQPLASALLVVKDLWWGGPAVQMNTISTVGLKVDISSNDLTSFLAAAGFAGASIMYNVQFPPFVAPPYTLLPFELPKSNSMNASAVVNTTAIKLTPGCSRLSVNSQQQPNQQWLNSVSLNECSFSWTVERTSEILFGMSLPTCSPAPEPQFSPAVFWFFSYDPTPIASAALCSPSLTIWDVAALVDVQSGNLTSVTELTPFSSQYSNFSAFSGNVTGAPLNGRAYNAIEFALDNPDPFALARQNATRLQLPAAVLLAAQRSEEGVAKNFQDNDFFELTNQGTYLSVAARDMYFLENNVPIDVIVLSLQKRVFFSPVATHLFAIALALLGICATLIHVLHRADRQSLNLKHEPGTIASAVALGAQTGVANVLADRQAEKDIEDALKDKKFRIDPATGKIIMQGELRYEALPTPSKRPQSFFELVGSRQSYMSGPSTPGHSAEQKFDV